MRFKITSLLEKQRLKTLDKLNNKNDELQEL